MVTSSFLASIGDGRQFNRGRQVAAWLGLVPRQYGSGGKMRLHGMTKSGDRYLRTMMLHGARAAIRWSRDRDTPLARWINPLIERRGFNKAVVALANKNARIAWNIVANDAHYDPGKAFGSA
jgi:transposase